MTKPSIVLVGKSFYFMYLVVDGIVKLKYVAKKRSVTLHLAWDGYQWWLSSCEQGVTVWTLLI